MVYFHGPIVSPTRVVVVFLLDLLLTFCVSSFVTTSSINGIYILRERKCACSHLAARGRGRNKKPKTVLVQNAEDHGDDSITTDDQKSFETISRKQPNRRERITMILERDGHDCLWCRTPLNIDTATADHLMPRIKGGPSWIANELAACRKCNKQRGHMLPLDWLEQCENRGFRCNRKAVEKCLVGLDREISI